MSRLHFQLETTAAGSQVRATRSRTQHNEVLTPAHTILPIDGCVNVPTTHFVEPNLHIGHKRVVGLSAKHLDFQRAVVRESGIFRKLMLFIMLGLVVVATVVLYGEFRWKSGTKVLRGRLEAARIPIAPKLFDSVELANVPTPVQRYLNAVLANGQPIVAAVRVEHAGTFNMGKTNERWKPFTSTQRVVTRRPGFDWDARVAMMPGVPVLVHDGYVAGEGILHAAVFGLISVARVHGTGEVARDELMRFFAEAVWYPTALLPSQGVRWHAVDDHAARATLEDGDLTLTLLFRFNEAGLIDTVFAESRGQMAGGKVTHAPWQCRLWNYAIRDGMRVPLDAEAAWVTPTGTKPYWRGHIHKLSYEFAQ